MPRPARTSTAPYSGAGRSAPPCAAPAQIASAAISGLASFIPSSLRRAPRDLIDR